MTTDAAIRWVEGSPTAADLFKSGDAKKTYHALSQALHPDKNPGHARAEQAFRKLASLYAALNTKSPVATEKVIGKWIVGEPLAKGDLCDLYHARSVADETKRAVFKLARSPKDTDLLEEEYVSLGMLHKQEAKGADNFKKYLPTAFERMDVSGRRANVISLSTESHTLADIMDLYPNGFDARHLVWMLNRALSVLGFIHKVGIVHGSVTPSHLIYGPASHSLTLVDWCYSVTAESNKHIPAVATIHKDLYPPEVFRKVPAHPAADIYMLFASMRATRCHIPKRLRALFDWAMVASPKSRPESAWELQDKLVVAAKEEFGPAKYIELKIPVT